VRESCSNVTSTEDSLRAELVVSDSSGCTVAEAAGPEGSGRSVARTRGDTVTEEAVLNDIEEPPEDAIPLFDDGESTLYRFERDSDGCVCELVEDHDCPVVDAHVRDGDLHVVFHVRDKECLRDVVRDLRNSYSPVEIRRVTTAEPEDADLVYADELTERQRDALETAYRMGYFEHPKEANATEVADAMGIAVSTFTEHLSAAQNKLTEEFLE
jgi:predicted DNA binding protein